MPNLPHSSSASATCRFDWKPSAALGFGLIAFGLLGGFSLLASDLPAWLAWPAAVGASGWGAWLAARGRRCLPVALQWRADGVLFVAGERVEQAELRWRGPMAFLAWSAPDGTRQRLAWWPDTLTAAQRRELRLAAAAADASRNRARVAP